MQLRFIIFAKAPRNKRDVKLLSLRACILQTREHCMNAMFHWFWQTLADKKSSSSGDRRGERWQAGAKAETNKILRMMEVVNINFLLFAFIHWLLTATDTLSLQLPTYLSNVCFGKWNLIYFHPREEFN